MKKPNKKSFKEYRTFDEWKSMGYIVEKGQKSHKKDKFGRALFAINQVVPYNMGNEPSQLDEYIDEMYNDKWLFT